jgi:hypothetical protein
MSAAMRAGVYHIPSRFRIAAAAFSASDSPKNEEIAFEGNVGLMPPKVC